MEQIIQIIRMVNRMDMAHGGQRGHDYTGLYRTYLRGEITHKRMICQMDVWQGERLRDLLVNYGLVNRHAHVMGGWNA